MIWGEFGCCRTSRPCDQGLSGERGREKDRPSMTLWTETLLHGLVQVASLVGTQRVESGHNKFPIEGSARQQPLGLFGVSSICILNKHLRNTNKQEFTVLNIQEIYLALTQLQQYQLQWNINLVKLCKMVVIFNKIDKK